MTADQCVAFLQALRAKNIRVKDNGWVEASCPLAKWLHKHHKDAKPSFGLSITPGSRSHFMCFACRQGSAEELVQVIELYSQASPDYDFVTCHKILTDETFVLPLPEYQEFPLPGTVFTEWPQYWLDSFKPAGWTLTASAYLTSREVETVQAEQFDLRYDPKRQMIVAPYRDVFGRLAGARGRSILPDTNYPHHDYTFQTINNARFVWFNEPVLNVDGPVVVVEGQFDCMRVARTYPKVVACLTAKPTLEKMQKLTSCPLIIHIPDRDEAGELSIPIYRRHCDYFNMEYQTLWLDEGVKDPAECHPEYLRDKILQLIA